MDGEGRAGRVVRMGVWQGVKGGKKYKNETGNWEIFSWNEPTKGNRLVLISFKR